MSSNRYLEFDSTYRDRNQYPEPSSFVVEMAQSGRATKYNARDPVCNASPILSWNSSFNESAGVNFVLITGITTAFSTTDQTILIVRAAAGQLRDLDDFYDGAILELTNDGDINRRRIIAYQRISTTEAQITVDSAFSIELTGATGSIQNPTNNTATDTVPKVFIPLTNFLINNFYYGYMIENITTGEIRNIIFYDGITHLATIDTNTAATWNDVNINLVIRKTSPVDVNTIQYQNTSGSVVQLANTGSPVSNVYISSYIRMIEVSGGGPPVPSFSTPAAPYGEERRITKYIAGDGTITAVANTVLTLDSTTSSNVDSYYVGGLFTDITIGGTETIVAYNGATRQITLAAPIAGAAPGDIWQMRSAFLQTPFTVAVGPPESGKSLRYEIELFTRDNYNPFVYTGSLVSSQEMVCYEVELLNLILPNTYLQSGRGGRPAFYPYLYVELQQVSAAGGGLKNIIYSNNPNSTKMLFRAAVDDTPTPLISPYIKIDGDGMVHTIKFKPNDSFKIAVYHANGELFRTVIQDSYSPTEPNPLVQISACFVFRRI